MAFNDQHPGAHNYDSAIEGYRMANARKSRGLKWIAEDNTRQGMIDFLYASPTGNSFFNSMIDAYQNWGALTINQEAAVRKSMEKVVACKAEYKAQAMLSNHIGEVGKRQDFILTVKAKVSVESDFGKLYIVTFTDKNENIVVYKGSKYVEYNKGDTLKVKATVKSHNEYEGAKQTSISRPKFGVAVTKG